MTDGESTFGVDTARYQPLGTYDRRDFEIINLEDPQLVVKILACITAGKPWGVYLWVYPGHALFVDAQHMVDVVRALGLGEPPAGFWFDYEDPGGITEGQLHDGFAGTDARGAHAGYYSGPSALDHSGFADRDWWNAAYPIGDETFPGYGALWVSSRPRPMNVWQYTSGGGLDRDVVVDEAWWAELAGAPTPAPTPAPRGGLRMDLIVGQLAQPGAVGNIPVPSHTPVALLVQGNRICASWADTNTVFGLPAGAAGWKSGAGRDSVDPVFVGPDELAAVIAGDAALRTPIDTNALAKALAPLINTGGGGAAVPYVGTVELHPSA